MDEGVGADAGADDTGLERDGFEEDDVLVVVVDLVGLEAGGEAFGRSTGAYNTRKKKATLVYERAKTITEYLRKLSNRSRNQLSQNDMHTRYDTKTFRVL